jgi:hypothetical protein
MQLGRQNICPTTFVPHVWHLRGKLGVNLPHLPHPKQAHGLATASHLGTTEEYWAFWQVHSREYQIEDLKGNTGTATLMSVQAH